MPIKVLTKIEQVCVWMCVTLNRYFSHIISQRKPLENRTFIAFYLVPSAFSTLIEDFY